MHQESCLGPLIFPIYINDINTICKSYELILFSDDTNIFVKGKSNQEVYIEANMILKQLSIIYTMLNKLHMNLQKSCFMYFQTLLVGPDRNFDSASGGIWSSTGRFGRY